MALPSFLRNGLIKLAKQDILDFLDEHEEELIRYFREEIEKVDHQMNEERLFIDIRMGPLGEVLVRAVLHAVRRFIADFGEDKGGGDDD